MLWHEPEIVEIAASFEDAVRLVKAAHEISVRILLVPENDYGGYANISKGEALEVLKLTPKDRVPSVELEFDRAPQTRRYVRSTLDGVRRAYIGAYRPPGLLDFIAAERAREARP
jgi:hypothetical protein